MMAIEAFRIAVGHMTPVIFLSDGYLANGSEPWLIPDADTLAKIESSTRPIRTAFIRTRATSGR
jgi:2-oxoglutarate ferredoxin oxidoreductase subunit alpha